MYMCTGLRALLIQKDTKLKYMLFTIAKRLRALLIQKDTKPVATALSESSV